MAKLTAAQRARLSKSTFAVPSKAPGSGSFPLPDQAHARNALARASGKPVEGQVRAAVRRKYPQIEQSSMTKRATKGSPPFTADELRCGYRSLG